MAQFRRGHGTTFASRRDRSGNALLAESKGLECARDAARRLRIRPWRRLEDADEPWPLNESHRIETHHVRLRTGVELLIYRPSEDWDRIAESLK